MTRLRQPPRGHEPKKVPTAPAKKLRGLMLSSRMTTRLAATYANEGALLEAATLYRRAADLLRKAHDLRNEHLLG